MKTQKQSVKTKLPRIETLLKLRFYSHWQVSKFVHVSQKVKQTQNKKLKSIVITKLRDSYGRRSPFAMSWLCCVSAPGVC